MLKFAQRKEARLLAALAAGGLVLSPAFARPAPAKKRPAAIALSFDPVSSFTPANADPKLAARFAGKGLALTDFKFTPAPAKGRPSQVRVAIRARSAAPAQTSSPTMRADERRSTRSTPTSYNLGVAVGWKRFAVSGDVAKVKDANRALGGRESAVVGCQLFAQQALHRPRRGRRRADRRPPAAGAAQGRQ